MKKRTFLIYVAYIWTKTLIGLTFHPFKSVREVVRRPVLFPVILSPFLGLFALFVAGRMAAILITLYGANRNLMAVFLSSVLLSVLFWQLLLLYLLFSFLLAIWKK